MKNITNKTRSAPPAKRTTYGVPGARSPESNLRDEQWIIPWDGVYGHLADLADAKLDPANFAMKVRQLYDALVDDTGDATTAREFLLFQVSALVSKQHCELVAKLLPKPPARERGRPRNALGKGTYGRKYKLYLDWTYESTVDPSLTKEQFAKKRLGVTNEQYKNSDSAHAGVDALLQDLKPARMKYLDEGHRNAVDVMIPLRIEYPRYLARLWRDAKQKQPTLTKEHFLQEFFGWTKHFGRVRRKNELHPNETEQINETLRTLDEGERQLGGSESPEDIVPKLRRPSSKSKFATRTSRRVSGRR